MVPEVDRQAIVDEEDLRLLSIFYWVSGATAAFFALYFLIYVAFGLIFVLAPFPESSTAQGGPPPAFMGWFFVFFGVAGVVGIGLIAVLRILTGFWIRQRRRRFACQVAAALSCLELPYGTMLGVFTFVVLARPTVAAQFATPVPTHVPPSSVGG